MTCTLPVLRIAVCLLGVLVAGFPGASLRSEDWPGWRGPRGDGTSLESHIPVTWDVPSGTHVRWSVPVPGVGHASPIVWGERLFLATCQLAEGSRELICWDRSTGRMLWQRDVIRAPLERKHDLNSYASGTPATDGEQVYVAFLEPDFSNATQVTPGNLVVAAYDFDGRQVWIARPGRFSSVHGFCSSPVLFEDMVIVNADHDGDSYIVALDRRNGNVVWKKPRPNRTRSYVTPIIREIDGRTQMVLSGSKHVASYDPHNGSVHWTIDGPTEQFVASLVFDGHLLFLTAGFPEHHILAIRPDGHGNVTDTHIVWRTVRGAAYVPSPIVEGPYLLVAADGGVVTCFDTATGTVHWSKRLAGHYSASPVSAAGLVYFLSDDGVTKVVRPGPEFELEAESQLGESCYASPAISGGCIYVRTSEHLFCLTDSAAP